MSYWIGFHITGDYTYISECWQRVNENFSFNEFKDIIKSHTDPEESYRIKLLGFKIQSDESFFICYPVSNKEWILKSYELDSRYSRSNVCEKIYESVRESFKVFVNERNALARLKDHKEEKDLRRREIKLQQKEDEISERLRKITKEERKLKAKEKELKSREREIAAYQEKSVDSLCSDRKTNKSHSHRKRKHSSNAEDSDIEFIKYSEKKARKKERKLPNHECCDWIPPNEHDNRFAVVYNLSDAEDRKQDEAEYGPALPLGKISEASVNSNNMDGKCNENADSFSSVKKERVFRNYRSNVETDDQNGSKLSTKTSNTENNKSESDSTVEKISRESTCKSLEARFAHDQEDANVTQEVASTLQLPEGVTVDSINAILSFLKRNASNV